MDKYWFTVAEAAEHLDCCTKTVYTFIKEGRLNAHKFGLRTYRISLDAFDGLYTEVPVKGRR
jgi:excisionase family DNA binding protein